MDGDQIKRLRALARNLENGNFEIRLGGNAGRGRMLFETQRIHANDLHDLLDDWLASQKHGPENRDPPPPTPNLRIQPIKGLDPVSGPHWLLQPDDGDDTTGQAGQ